ncbi:MAG: hypothetical protein AB8B59_17170 [Maribacter sp.]
MLFKVEWGAWLIFVIENEKISAGVYLERKRKAGMIINCYI